MQEDQWEAADEVWRRGVALGLQWQWRRSRKRRAAGAVGRAVSPRSDYLWLPGSGCSGIWRRQSWATFWVIITGGDVAWPKPDAQGIELALAALGTTSEGAVYIGDTVNYGLC
ncbi:MAG: HAD family hydrolase [Chloroflexi bacterium]|nr:HAD family hydrolase [Chloroflexota bacterium]